MFETCPLLTLGIAHGVTNDCMVQKCQWWIESHSRCAIAVIAISQVDIASNVDLIDTSLKKIEGMIYQQSIL